MKQLLLGHLDLQISLKPNNKDDATVICNICVCQFNA